MTRILGASLLMIFSACKLPEYEKIPACFPFYNEQTHVIEECICRELYFSNESTGLNGKAYEVPVEECQRDVIVIGLDDYISTIIPHNKEIIDQFRKKKAR